MSSQIPEMGLGIGWRPELSHYIAQRNDLGFVEVMAEYFYTKREIPRDLQQLLDRDMQIIPHSVSMSLGSAELPDKMVLEHVSWVADLVDAPFVSDHICFTHSDGENAGHLMPVERNEKTLEVLIENINYAQEFFDVPLVLENIAILLDWPEQEIPEAEFISQLLRKTDCKLLLDISNLYANYVNLGWDIDEYLEALPLEKIAYIHVAGGMVNHGVYVDSHSHSLEQETMIGLELLCEKIQPKNVMLERDGNFPPSVVLDRDLDLIRTIVFGDGANE